MEAVPRLPMLKLEHKACIDQPVFSIALKKYIREHYNEDPSSYTSEIQELEQLRSSITFARRDFEYCNSLRKYFCQLRFLLSRFPISQPETDSLNITFYWKDLYSATVHEVADIRYEQASILYNIAVYHMTEGAAENRSTPDGMKISCTHFQCAAWAFQHLRENFLQSSDCDLSPQLMSLLHTIALAQAQECILEKSISDNRKPNIIARVAMQVVEYLSGVVRVLESKSSPVHDIIGSRIVKTWLRYCQLKQVYYHSVTQLYLGLQAEELQKMGERLAFFKDANSRLAAAAKLAKNMDDEEAIRECLNFSHDVMGGKLSAAQKENEFVFHEKVPDISSLPEVKGASLVKEIPFSMTDPDISGPDIFRNLIPIEAHQASSLYSEEKASLLRSLGARLQEKNDELEAFLASLQLEDLLLDEDPDALPQELVSACADMNARDALRELTEVMQKVSSAHLTIADMLDRQDALLEEEDNRAAEFRTIVGDKKAPTNVLTELRREGDKCRSALMAASDSNVALHAAVVQHRPTLTTLSQPLQRVASSLPSVAAAITQQSGESGKEAKLQIERLMKKVEEMQQQRWSVEKQLRQNLMEDDITGTLVTADADMADIFKEHLQKHNKELEILEKNMLAQNNILKALSEANAAYASTRRAMKQTMAARQAAVAALVQAHASFTSILDKAKDANLFYEKLNTQVTKLLKRTESLVSVQEEERASRLKAQAKKFSSTRPQAASHAPSAKNAINFPTHAPHAPVQGGDDLASYAGSGPKLKDVLMASGGYKGLGSTLLPGQPSPQHGGSAFSPASTGYRVDVSSAAALAAMASATTAAASSNTGHTSMGATPSNIRDSGYSNENQVASQASYLQSSSQVPGAYSQTPAYSSQVPGGYSQPSAAISYGSSVGYPCYPPSAPSPAPQLPSSHFSAAVSTTGNTPVLTSYQSSQYAAAAAQHAATAGAPSYTSPATTEYFASNYTTDPSLSSKPTTATHPCATVPSAATYQASSGPNTYHTQANSTYLASSIASPYYSASAYGQQVGANLAAASVQVTPVTASGQHPQTNSIPSSITNEVAAASGTIPIATSGSHIPAQGYYYNQPYASGFTQPHVTSSSVTGQQFPANATTPYASETRASVPFTTSQVYPAPTTTLAQSNPINVTGNQSSLPTNLAYPAAMASYATPQPNVSTVASSSAAIPSMNYGSDGKNLAAAGQTSYPGFAPGSSTSQLQPPYGSSALQYQSGSYQVQHAYHTPQHLISPFTPNQYPSGSGTYTPSMSIASSLKSSVPYHVQSNTYYSTTASATSSGTTVVNSSDAIDGRSPYRHASATPAVPSYFYACAGAGAPSSMTPSSTGSPLPSAGFGVKENGVAGTSTTQPYPAYPAYASHQYSAGVYPVQLQQMNYPGQTLYSQTSQLPSGPSQTSQQAPLPAVTKPSDAAPASKGISNLDLLSGIELAGPSSMWTPLTPKRSQDTVTENSTLSSVVTTDATVPITSVESEVSFSAKEGCHSSVTDDAESSVSKTDAISNAESVSVNGSAEKVVVPDKGSTDAISTSKETISISTAALNMAALAQSKKAAPPQDPLDDAGTLAALTSDTERLHKTVETLERRSLNGPTNLEVKWREIQEAVEARCKKSTVSVSRCYPLKNRFPDILPYDHSRVVLTDAYDDYINASHVQLRGSHSFPVVVSQAPTPATAADYWLMVWQLQTELIVCLHTLPEIKNASYWPESRGTQQYGDMSVREHNSGEGGGGAWVQRLFHLTRTSNSGSSSSTRAVIHLQFLRWPPGGMPSHPSPVLQLCSEALSLHRQQRVRQRPVLYTCVPGVGRSCVAALLMVFLNHLHSAGSVCDLQSLCEDACVARRGGLQDKDYLAFLYSAALYAAQELLMKRGILTNKATFDEGPIEKGHRQHVRHPSADLLAANCDFNRLKSKLGLGETEDKVGNPTTDQENGAASNGNCATTEKNETSRPKSASPALPIPSMVGVSLPPNLAASLDPQQLKIEPVAPGKGAKITKESFERPPQAGLAGRAQDPDDPLSSLDPLWTLKKSE